MRPRHNKDFASNKNWLPIFLLGILCGTILLSLLLFFIRLAPEDIYRLKISATDLSTLLAGFGGAIIGGVVSWALAWQASHEARWRDFEQRTAVEASAAKSLLFKLIDITNGTDGISRHIAEAETLRQGEDPLWQHVQAMAGRPNSTPVLDTLEYLPFLNAKYSHLINRATLASQRYAALDGALRLYSERRVELQDILAGYTTLNPIDGQMVTNIPVELRGTVSVRANELESLIQQLKQMSEVNLADDKALCAEVAGAIEEMFAISVGVEFS
jgi:hypothetical protein